MLKWCNASLKKRKSADSCSIRALLPFMSLGSSPTNTVAAATPEIVRERSNPLGFRVTELSEETRQVSGISGVRIADALDMAKGRSRIPFSAGSLSIHSVSAAAVESVSIERGEEKPIRVTIELSNSAGLFQLDQLLRDKLDGSGLEPHMEIDAKVGEEEKRLLTDFRL